MLQDKHVFHFDILILRGYLFFEKSRVLYRVNDFKDRSTTFAHDVLRAPVYILTSVKSIEVFNRQTLKTFENHV